MPVDDAAGRNVVDAAARPLRWSLRENDSSPEWIAPLAHTIGAMGVVILPTDTVYGLHARATDSSSIARIMDLKGRSDDKPMLVLVSGLEQCSALGARIGDHLRRYLEQAWPASLTAIVPIANPIPATAGATTIALRVPPLAWLLRLLAMTGPLASTSLNRAGEPSVREIREAPDSIERGVDAIVDGGRLGGKPSTLVDFTASPPRVVRQGDFPFSQKLWKSSRKSL